MELLSSALALFHHIDPTLGKRDSTHIGEVSSPATNPRRLDDAINSRRPTTLPFARDATREQTRASRLHPPRRHGDNAFSVREMRSRGLLSWEGPAVTLADTVMEEEECEDGRNRPASGRKRSREQLVTGSSSRGRTMLLRYRRNVAAARTSNRYGVIGHRVLGCRGVTRPAANGPKHR